MTNKIKLFALLFVFVGMLFLVTSCGEDKISISGVSSLIVGQQTTLTAELVEETETEEEIKFIWESEHPNIATVPRFAKRQVNRTP